jgi:hypothetical protein
MHAAIRDRAMRARGAAANAAQPSRNLLMRVCCVCSNLLQAAAVALSRAWQCAGQL